MPDKNDLQPRLMKNYLIRIGNPRKTSTFYFTPFNYMNWVKKEKEYQLRSRK